MWNVKGTDDLKLSELSGSFSTHLNLSGAGSCISTAYVTCLVEHGISSLRYT